MPNHFVNGPKTTKLTDVSAVTCLCGFAKLQGNECIFTFLTQVSRHPRSVADENKYIELMVINDHLMVS